MSNNKEKQKKQYCIQAKMNLLVSTTVVATSLEEALEASKDSKEIDFIDFKDSEYLDGEIKITGVYEA